MRRSKVLHRTVLLWKKLVHGIVLHLQHPEFLFYKTARDTLLYIRLQVSLLRNEGTGCIEDGVHGRLHTKGANRAHDAVRPSIDTAQYRIPLSSPVPGYHQRRGLSLCKVLSVVVLIKNLHLQVDTVLRNVYPPPSPWPWLSKSLRTRHLLYIRQERYSTAQHGNTVVDIDASGH